MVGKDGRVGKTRSKQRDALLAKHTKVVAVCLLYVRNEGVDVREIRLDENGLKFGHVGEAPVKENDVHDVVADVSFPLDLKYIRVNC